MRKLYFVCEYLPGELSPVINWGFASKKEAYRRADAIITAYESEDSFYVEVTRFEPNPEALEEFDSDQILAYIDTDSQSALLGRIQIEMVDDSKVIANWQKGNKNDR